MYCTVVILLRKVAYGESVYSDTKIDYVSELQQCLLTPSNHKLDEKLKQLANIYFEHLPQPKSCINPIQVKKKNLLFETVFCEIVDDCITHFKTAIEIRNKYKEEHALYTATVNSFIATYGKIAKQMSVLPGVENTPVKIKPVPAEEIQGDEAVREVLFGSESLSSAEKEKRVADYAASSFRSSDDVNQQRASMEALRNMQPICAELPVSELYIGNGDTMKITASHRWVTQFAQNHRLPSSLNFHMEKLVEDMKTFSENAREKFRPFYIDPSHDENAKKSHSRWSFFKTSVDDAIVLNRQHAIEVNRYMITQQEQIFRSIEDCLKQTRNFSDLSENPVLKDFLAKAQQCEITVKFFRAGHIPPTYFLRWLTTKTQFPIQLKNFANNITNTAEMIEDKLCQVFTAKDSMCNLDELHGDEMLKIPPRKGCIEHILWKYYHKDMITADCLPVTQKQYFVHINHILTSCRTLHNVSEHLATIVLPEQLAEEEKYKVIISTFQDFMDGFTHQAKTPRATQIQSVINILRLNGNLQTAFRAIKQQMQSQGDTTKAELFVGAYQSINNGYEYVKKTILHFSKITKDLKEMKKKS